MRRLLTIFFIFIIFSGCKADFSSIGRTASGVAYSRDESATSEVSDDNGRQSFYSAPSWDVETYKNLFQQANDIGDVGVIRGAIVPHHLVAGYMPATLFKYLGSQKPSLVVLIGPNHSQPTSTKIYVGQNDWQTPFGVVRAETNLAKSLSDSAAADINDEIFNSEYSISALIPFIANALPQSRVLPIIIPYYTDTGKLDNLIARLVPLLPDDAVIISSVDFSHYQNSAVAAFHDELNRSVINNFDFDRIAKMEIDSPASIYMLLKIMQSRGSQKIAYEVSDNSARILNDPSLDEITSYYSPYFVDGDANIKKTSSILFFGDMMLDRNVKKQIDANGADYIFSKLAGEENRFFMGMDLVHANLEGPFADYRRNTTKEIAFRFDPILIPMLKNYNFGMFSQANNHSSDMGSEGFTESKDNLNAAGFGVYGSQYRIDEESLLIKKVGDYNIAFIGLNDTNSPIDLQKVNNLIIKGRKDADLVVINIHWGTEYKEISNERQRFLAHQFIDEGADVIIGHHPHVVEEMEIYKNRPIFYSLGNFVFDQYFSVPTQQGLGAGLVFKNKSISAYVFPLEENNSQPRQMPYEEKIKYFDSWLKNCRLGNYQFESQTITVQL